MVNYFTTKKDEAKAVSLNAQISLKYSVELADFIKRKPVEKVLAYLDDVIALKKHVPLRTYNSDIGHKKGDAQNGVKSGRYPVNVAKHFKKVLLSAKNNADVKGLDKDNLLLVNVIVSQGVRRFKIQPKGRRRGRKSKATNIEMLVKTIKTKKVVKKVATKVEATKETKDVKKVAKEVKETPVKKAVAKKKE